MVCWYFRPNQNINIKWRGGWLSRINLRSEVRPMLPKNKFSFLLEIKLSIRETQWRKYTKSLKAQMESFTFSIKSYQHFDQKIIDNSINLIPSCPWSGWFIDLITLSSSLSPFLIQYIIKTPSIIIGLGGYKFIKPEKYFETIDVHNYY